MASQDLKAFLGPMELAGPLVAASGTVGSVWEWATVADVSFYGAAVAKSVSEEPWAGRPSPRIAPEGPGMLNGIGIQNPGLKTWSQDMKPRTSTMGVPVWGSAVGETVAEFARVAVGLEEAGVAAIEINLSCPNLDGGKLFALDEKLSASVVSEVRQAVKVPIGAKLSPNSEQIVSVARAVADAGADFVTLTNTALGFGVDLDLRRPKLSGGIGGYSGPGLKAISLRCVYEVASALPHLSILGCGGVSSGDDVVEYLMAGASAVAIGTVHLSEPRAGRRIFREMERTLKKLGARNLGDVIGAAIL
jgi:dihydroorotate dehydrogenase (NAD+) catalytic subunit